MSNTSSVTPYQSDRAGAAAAAAAAAVGWAVAALAEALAATDGEREMIARYRSLARAERLGGARLDCRIADNGDLVAAARSLGFDTVRPADRASLASGRLDLGRPIELVDRKGAAMVLQRTADCLAIISSDGQGTINDVVRQVTVTRARRHLAALSGGEVVSRRLANGEIELQACEVRSRHDGAATVTARVAPTGVLQVDVAGLRGARCEQLLSELAEAVGGEIDAISLKPEYYATPVAPGEPVRIGLGG
jgi:hypothetical protein